MENKLLPLVVSIDTSAIAYVEGGLQLNPSEQFLLVVPEEPTRPPDVLVMHDRFVGFPHVMHGRQLCVYLDPSREWNPANLALGFADRLWAWLTDASAARFAAGDSLYHAIGGVPSGATADTVLVVREDVANSPTRLHGVFRTDRRIDLQSGPTSGSFPILSWPCAKPLPLGAGDTLRELLDAINNTEGQVADPFLDALRAQASRSDAVGHALYFLLSVPHPAGGPTQVVAGRLNATAAAAMRKGSPELNATIIEWCAVSDERDAVTTRRDTETAAAGFFGASVYLYGCGALGSWIGELIVRAGAASVTLNDPGRILGGLLVRQNYVEDDVGQTKSTALAQRLERLADRATVLDAAVASTEDHGLALAAADFIIDATANVAAAQMLQSVLMRIPERVGIVAQVATDPAHGNKGLLTIAGVGDFRALFDIDNAAGESVVARYDLEEFHTFWAQRIPTNQITPTRGCSIPTFHGSAADMAAIAGILVSTLARHRGSGKSGTHMFRLPAQDRTCAAWIEVPAP
jgi:hypothetical protein